MKKRQLFERANFGNGSMIGGKIALNAVGFDFELEFYKLSVDGNSKSFGHWWHRR